MALLKKPRPKFLLERGLLGAYYSLVAAFVSGGSGSPLGVRCQYLCRRQAFLAVGRKNLLPVV